MPFPGSLTKQVEAEDVEFDNTTSGLAATEVQGAVDELVTTVGVSASPGFVYDWNGIKGPGNWGANNGKRSDKVGVPVLFDDAVVTQVAIGSNGEAAYTIGIYQHSGGLNNLQLLGQVAVVVSGPDVFNVDFPVNPIFNKKQLAVKIDIGSVKDLKVSLSLKGTVGV